jgi:ABC-type glycerol-3-phosphate transport system substrate-binding protein
MLKGAALLAIIAGLAACSSGSNNGSSASMMAAPTPIDFLAQDYGTVFAADYRMPSTATPPVPMSGDIVPLNLTTQPYTQF